MPKVNLYLDDTTKIVQETREDSFGNPETYERYQLRGDPESSLCSLLRGITSLLCVLSFVLVVLRELAYLDFMTVNNNEFRRLKWKDHKAKARVICEAIYLLIHSPPSINMMIETTQNGEFVSYNSDVIFNLFMQFRSLYVLKLNILFSDFNSLKAQKLCRKMYVSFDSQFILKCMIKKQPYLITIIWLSVSLVIFGYGINTFEKAFMHVSGFNWNSYWNGVWNVIITMSTVGYGDIFARTHFGRVVAILVMFWGAFINSLILVAMQITSEFTSQEKAAFERMIYTEDLVDVMKETIKLVQSSYIVYKINKKNGSKILKGLSIKKKVKWFTKNIRNKIRFHRARKEFKVNYSNLELEKEVDHLEKRFDKLWRRTTEMCRSINQIDLKTDKLKDMQDEVNWKLDKFEDDLEDLSEIFDTVALNDKQIKELNDNYFGVFRKKSRLMGTKAMRPFTLNKRFAPNLEQFVKFKLTYDDNDADFHKRYFNNFMLKHANHNFGSMLFDSGSAIFKSRGGHVKGSGSSDEEDEVNSHLFGLDSKHSKETDDLKNQKMEFLLDLPDSEESSDEDHEGNNPGGNNAKVEEEKEKKFDPSDPYTKNKTVVKKRKKKKKKKYRVLGVKAQAPVKKFDIFGQIRDSENSEDDKEMKEMEEQVVKPRMKKIPQHHDPEARRVSYVTAKYEKKIKAAEPVVFGNQLGAPTAVKEPPKIEKQPSIQKRAPVISLNYGALHKNKNSSSTIAKDKEDKKKKPRKKEVKNGFVDEFDDMLKKFMADDSLALKNKRMKKKRRKRKKKEEDDNDTSLGFSNNNYSSNNPLGDRVSSLLVEGSNPAGNRRMFSKLEDNEPDFYKGIQKKRGDIDKRKRKKIEMGKRVMKMFEDKDKMGKEGDSSHYENYLKNKPAYYDNLFDDEKGFNPLLEDQKASLMRSRRGKL